MNTAGSTLPATRLCPNCGASQPIAAGEPVWPVGWICVKCGVSPGAAEGFPLFCPRLNDTLTGCDPEGFASLAQAEERHFWFQARNRLLVGLLRRYFPGARSLLEIGCGTGNVGINVATTTPESLQVVNNTRIENVGNSGIGIRSTTCASTAAHSASRPPAATKRSSAGRNRLQHRPRGSKSTAAVNCSSTTA